MIRSILIGMRVIQLSLSVFMQGEEIMKMIKHLSEFIFMFANIALHVVDHAFRVFIHQILCSLSIALASMMETIATRRKQLIAELHTLPRPL